MTTSSGHTQGEGRRLRGMSVATKLALTTGAIIALIMLVFGLVFARFVRQTVKDQVLQAAVEAARTAAQADLDAWTPYFATEDQGLTPEQVADKVSGMSPFEFRAYDNEPRKDLLEWNRQRLPRALGEETRILAVEVFRFVGGVRDRLVASSYTGDMKFSPVLGSSSVLVGRGQATEGLLTAGGVTRHVIRGSHPIAGPDGSQQGELGVYIHARAVDEATAAFQLKVAYAAAFSVLAGAAIAFLAGKALTRPLHKLQDDIRVVASGDLQHHTKLHSRDEFGELARTFDHMTQSLAEARDAEREAAASRHQMAVAAEVAARLSPSRLPVIAGFDNGGLHNETGKPAGDYYDVLPMADGCFGFLVADASGSGVPAAMVLSMARSFLRAVSRTQSDPGDVLREVNGLLSGDLRRGMYVTVLLMVLDPSNGRVLFANAGHPPLLHWSAADGLLMPIHSEGIALGFDKGPVFDRALKVGELTLQPGDRVVLYTQALAHLRGADGTELGDQRLLGLMRREMAQPAEAFLSRVEATLSKFQGGKLDGEVTLLSLGRLA